MKAKYFTALSLVTTKNICGVLTLLSLLSAINFKTMKNTASIFTITWASTDIFFYFGNTPCVEGNAYLFEISPRYLKTYEKMKYTFPSY